MAEPRAKSQFSLGSCKGTSQGGLQRLQKAHSQTWQGNAALALQDFHSEQSGIPGTREREVTCPFMLQQLSILKTPTIPKGRRKSQKEEPVRASVQAKRQTSHFPARVSFKDIHQSSALKNKPSKWDCTKMPRNTEKHIM